MACFTNDLRQLLPWGPVDAPRQAHLSMPQSTNKPCKPLSHHVVVTGMVSDRILPLRSDRFVACVQSRPVPVPTSAPEFFTVSASVFAEDAAPSVAFQNLFPELLSASVPMKQFVATKK